ncbi:hypothetical protein [Devosia salina]|uniref:Uncharacterized protein n=1 Tax=Devosia salina TaxID=2860336 RepID=A0ABX8WIG5_9HYPH|nr:hypothetical protein [Devosia salina]QYO76085.1 hypothetical protein K1X15_15895 [Devosia salina]
MAHKQEPGKDNRPEVDRVITEHAQDPLERAVLGTNPHGSMLRIAAFVLLFIVLGGGLFFYLGM